MTHEEFPMHGCRTIAAFTLLFASLPLSAATWNVTRADDPVPGSCLAADCSLREAVMAAAVTPEADTVLLPAGTFTVTRGALTATGNVTIRGAGSTSTSLVGTSDDDVITGGALSELTLEGLRFATGESPSIEVIDGRLVLRDIDMPNDANSVSVRELSLTASLDVEASRIPLVACTGDTVSCEISDSEVAVMGAIGAMARLDVRGLVSVGLGNSTGLFVMSNGRVHVADSTFSGHARPIDVSGSDADILVERTRFVGNTGPMRGEGDGMVRFDDVEFSDNLVSDANLTLPAVLLATDGVAWRFNRSLFEGNRGGGGGAYVGAVIAADVGANVVITNSTFVDNTYRSGVASTTAHTLGAVSTAADPTILWVFHSTLRRASSVAASTLGSLVSVSGAGSSVRLFNSVLDGTCRFGNGGAILQALGSIESIGNTCGLVTGDNFVNVPAGQLGLGALADNGGFTRSVMPAAGSFTIDRGDETACLFAFGLDQRRHVRPGGGIDCDVGAVERDAPTDSLFADAFD